MEVSLKDLEKEISNSKIPVLLEVWSSWCLPCQAMKNTLKELEKEFQGKIKILRINPDLNPAVSSRYNIKGVPTFILFTEGKEITRVVGAKSKKELLQMIEGLIS